MDPRLKEEINQNINNENKPNTVETKENNNNNEINQIEQNQEEINQNINNENIQNNQETKGTTCKLGLFTSYNPSKINFICKALVEPFSNPI